MSVSERIRDLPVYASRDTTLSAARFNRARLALLRLGEPLVLHIKPLKHMAMIVENDVWAVIDEVRNEYPIVAWTEFHVGERRALHAPVPCRMLIFHEHAERIIEIALESTDRMLAERLAEN